MVKRGDVSSKAGRTIRSLLPNPAENRGAAADRRRGRMK